MLDAGSHRQVAASWGLGEARARGGLEGSLGKSPWGKAEEIHAYPTPCVGSGGWSSLPRFYTFRCASLGKQHGKRAVRGELDLLAVAALDAVLADLHGGSQISGSTSLINRLCERSSRFGKPSRAAFRDHHASIADAAVEAAFGFTLRSC